MDEEDEENVLRILIATDNHLGYCEKDSIRGSDSFSTFEEILQLARGDLEPELCPKVDMILLGGDLFHDNKPSRRCLFRTMDLLRKYTQGDDPVNFEVVSDQSVNFPKRTIVNYEDPNVNVDMPVFSIHGNHDDPAGDGHFAALDLLSVSSLVNYFGQQEDLNKVDIKPLLFQKGETNVACYGLGNIRDERLHTTWEKGYVQFVQPAKFSWFKIFVLHQNRAHHSAKSYVDPSKIPEDMDLVIWGHEHECLVQLEANANGFHITQPGSSVATSLNEGEARQKHVGFLEISKSRYRLVPIPLKSVRPYVFKQISLMETVEESGLEPKNNDPTMEEAVSAYLEEKVNEMILEAKDAHPHLHEGSLADPKKALPLIRLRVDWTGFCTVNRQRFGQLFVGRVANPSDLLQFMKSSAKKESRKAGTAADDDEVDMDEFMGMNDDERGVNIVDLVTKEELKDLKVLPSEELKDAVEQYVTKDDNDAIKNFVDKALRDTQDYLRKESQTMQAAEDVGNEDEALEDLVTRHRDECNMQARVAKETQMSQDVGESSRPNATQESARSRVQTAISDDDSGIDDDDEFAKAPVQSQRSAAAPKASSRAPSSRAKAPRGSASQKQSTLSFGKKGANKKTVVVDTDEDESDGCIEDDDSEEEVPAKRRKTPAKAAPTKSRTAAKTADPPAVVESQQRSSRGRAGPAIPTNEVVNLDSDDDDDQSVQGLSVTSNGKRKWGSRARR